MSFPASQAADTSAMVDEVAAVLVTVAPQIVALGFFTSPAFATSSIQAPQPVDDRSEMEQSLNDESAASSIRPFPALLDLGSAPQCVSFLLRVWLRYFITLTSAR